jgi:hypothetical protein
MGRLELMNILKSYLMGSEPATLQLIAYHLNPATVPRAPIN